MSNTTPTFATLAQAEAAAFKYARQLGPDWRVAICHMTGEFGGPFYLDCTPKEETTCSR